jgi:tetratricopeptide (TPR) repeat protein
MRRVLAAVGASVCLHAGAVASAESDPLPVPNGGARARAVASYNDGVRLMLDKRYADAQSKFETALALDERLAEAHNNLAFSLRMQGARNFERALKHYDRALELKPDLAQAYMYRGVLFAQTGELRRAAEDHARLLKLDRQLAAKLEAVIVGRVLNEGTAGLAAQYE